MYAAVESTSVSGNWSATVNVNKGPASLSYQQAHAACKKENIRTKYYRTMAK